MNQNQSLQVQAKSLQGSFKEGDANILTYKIEYPFFTSTRYEMCLNKLNRFYQEQAQTYQRYVETELYLAAKEQYAFAMEKGFPVMEYQAVQAFTMTYQQGCILSLYRETYEFTGGAHGSTVRDSQTWNLQGCRQLTLTDLILCGPDPKTYIVQEAVRQIRQDPDIYFEDSQERLSDAFRPESFYAASDGLVVYYQQYDIAPYSSGIRTFLLPYGECVRNPLQTCF